MRMLLINPPYTSNEPLLFSYGEPLGLAYVAAAVRASGRHEAALIDGIGLKRKIRYKEGHYRVGLENSQVYSLIDREVFDVLGIGVTRMYYDAGEILKFVTGLRHLYPNKPIVVGGPDATIDPAMYLMTSNVDCVVLGEGEESVVDLLDALQANRPLMEVSGLALPGDGGNICRTPSRRFADINSLPWPARDLLPMHNYFANKQQGAAFPTASVLTSRSCPEKCVFCNVSAIWGLKWRGRAPADVVAEMRDLVATYGVKQINVVDDNFMVNEKRVEKICDEIVVQQLQVKWVVVPGLAAWHLRHDLIVKMVEAGLAYLQVQVETGDPESLAYTQKRVSLEHVREMLAVAKSVGLRTGSNIIIGFPLETREQIYRSIATAESLGIDDIDYILAEPKAGTRMYDDYVRFGLIDPGRPVTMPVDTLKMKGRELLEIQQWANAQHVSNKDILPIKGCEPRASSTQFYQLR